MWVILSQSECASASRVIGHDSGRPSRIRLLRGASSLFHRQALVRQKRFSGWPKAAKGML